MIITETNQELKQRFEFTDSEVQITFMLLEGKSPKEIAEARYRSIFTVRTQIKSILAKANQHSTTGLMAFLASEDALG